MYGEGTSSDVTFSLLLFNSFAKVCPARGHQRSRPSHSPLHAKLTHNTATPIKRSTTTYDKWDYKAPPSMGCISQPVDGPRSEDNNSPPLSSTSFVLKGLPQRTPFAIVHTSLGISLPSSPWTPSPQVYHVQIDQPHRPVVGRATRDAAAGRTRAGFNPHGSQCC
jgi:hypothetical protein